MKEIIKKYMKDSTLYIIIAIVLLAIIRIIIGNNVGIWYQSNQIFDDRLLVEYSSFYNHFYEPNPYSLVKTIGYPLFINIGYILNMILNIKFSMLLSIIWIIDALYVGYIVYKISNKKSIALFAYCYILFFPTAFESWMGTRMYRNSIIAPFVLLFFCLLLRNVYSLQGRINYKNEIFKAILLGIVFSFTYYIKEDGLWLLACLMLFMLIELVYLCIRIKKEKWETKNIIKIIIVFLIPIIIFIFSFNLYKIINKHYFGVYEIETRTSGELGKFVSNIYKVDSDNRNGVCWAPKDAIEKVFDTSDTLKKYPELKYDVLHSDWCQGDIDTLPINGDFLTWVLRTSLIKTDIWESDEQISNLFSKINDEINQAFKDGNLKKSNHIQLLSSAGGRTFSEILDLGKIMAKSYQGAIVLDGYTEGCVSFENGENEITAQTLEKKTGEKYLIKETRNTEDIISTNRVVSYVFSIYKILNIILVVSLLVNILISSIQFILFLLKKINKFDLINYIIVICLTGISIAYTFAVSWFTEFIYVSEFNQKIQNFYCIALPIILVFPYLISLNMNWNNIKYLLKKSKKNDENL